MPKFIPICCALMLFFATCNAAEKADTAKKVTRINNEVTVFNYFFFFPYNKENYKNFPVLFYSYYNPWNPGDGFGVGYSKRIYRNFWLGGSYLRWEEKRAFPDSYLNDILEVRGPKWNTPGNIEYRRKYHYADLTLSDRISVNKWTFNLGAGVSRAWGDNLMLDSIVQAYLEYPKYYEHLETNQHYYGVSAFVKVEYNIWQQYITAGFEWRNRKFFGLDSYEYDLCYSLNFHF